MVVAAAVAGNAPRVSAVEAPATTASSYAILGLEDVMLRGQVEVDGGDVGCNAQGGTVTMNASARVIGAVAADEIRLGFRARADRLFCSQLVPIRRTSATCAPATTPLVDPATLPLVQIDAGKDDVRLPRLATRMALPAGAYGVLRLGQRAQLTLAGGDYAFRSIDLEDRAQLLCESACTIGVDEEVLLKDDVQLGAMPPLDAHAVRVNVHGGLRSQAAFRAYRRSIVGATVYAPNGGIVLGINGRYSGAFIGKTILVYQHAQITAASDF